MSYQRPNGDRFVPFQIGNCVVPVAIVRKIEKFLLDKCTGNVRLNVLEGRVDQCHIEEVVRVKKGDRTM